MLRSEKAEPKSRSADDFQVIAGLPWAEEDLEALRVGSAGVEKLMAKSASLIAETKQAMADLQTLDACFPELEVAAVTQDYELLSVVQAHCILNRRVAVG